MVSRVCKQLRPLATHTVDGVETHEPVKLQERWPENYPGAGGQQFGRYSLDPIVQQTFIAVCEVQLLDVHPLVSEDMATDRFIAPSTLPAAAWDPSLWRRPPWYPQEPQCVAVDWDRRLLPQREPETC